MCGRSLCSLRSLMRLKTLAGTLYAFSSQGAHLFAADEKIFKIWHLSIFVMLLRLLRTLNKTIPEASTVTPFRPRYHKAIARMCNIPSNELDQKLEGPCQE